jgi:hypothetical protein
VAPERDLASDIPASLAFYFGLSVQGTTDVRYMHTVNAISKQTDDCIFFTDILLGDLREHGTKLRGLDVPWNRLPGLTTIEIADDALMPARKEYEAWLKGFPAPAMGWKKLLKQLRG